MHDTVVGILKCFIPGKTASKRSFSYSKDDYNIIQEEDTLNFARDKYFNGHQNIRKIEENGNMIKNFLKERIRNNIIQFYIKCMQMTHRSTHHAHHLNLSTHSNA